MILKQNCFIITDNELNALESGTYQEPTRLMKNEKGLFTMESPITYTGSSIQRRNYKVTKSISKQIRELKISLLNKKITDSEKFIITKKISELEVLPLPEKKSNIERELSSRSKTKITNKILAWSHSRKHNSGNARFTFLTLTTTSKQIGNDTDFTKMLNTFFTYCRKYFNLNNYLYVLEKQTKNTGNIHSHILIDHPLPIQRLNYIWCKILGDNGYTFPSTDLRTGITQHVNVNEAIKLYHASPIIPNQKAGHKKRYVNSPNPADIEYIYNLKAVQKYVTKYITKNDTKITTTIWNCSQSISRLWVGAKISALKYFNPLYDNISHKIRLTPDEGHTLNICLLKFYTEIQNKIFGDINRQYLIQT